MPNLFKPDFFINNRQKLQHKANINGPIVITANGLLQKGGDLVYEFYQDRNFWYLTGIDLPGFILVIDENEEFLIEPPASKVSKVMEGGYDIAELKKQSGIIETYDESVGFKKLKSSLGREVGILTAPDKYINEYGFYTNPARAELISKLRTLDKGTKQVSINRGLARLRSIKQPDEIEALKYAVFVTEDALKIIKENISLFKTEAQVDAFISTVFKTNNCEVAFDSIVASGSNATTIHYTKNSDQIKNNTFVVLDVGASYFNYCADISRTYSYGEITKRQREVYDAVLMTQQFAMNEIRPGVHLKKYEKLVEEFMGDRLKSLGLIKEIKREAIRKYFPHSTSHFLGLETHDVGEYDKPLEANMVITVEPGIYIQEEGIGVRIEDDLLITKKGYAVLSTGVDTLIN